MCVCVRARVCVCLVVCFGFYLVGWLVVAGVFVVVVVFWVCFLFVFFFLVLSPKQVELPSVGMYLSLFPVLSSSFHPNCFSFPD